MIHGRQSSGTVHRLPAELRHELKLHTDKRPGYLDVHSAPKARALALMGIVVGDDDGWRVQRYAKLTGRGLRVVEELKASAAAALAEVGSEHG